MIDRDLPFAPQQARLLRRQRDFKLAARTRFHAHLSNWAQFGVRARA
jgi:hypothetical protein